MNRPPLPGSGGRFSSAQRVGFGRGFNVRVSTDAASCASSFGFRTTTHLRRIQATARAE